MTAKDEYLTPNSTITFDLNQLKSPLSNSKFCNNYLRETIGEPLSNALAYVLIYRPEDPIEFISNLLIDWSRKMTRQEMFGQKFEPPLVESLLHDQEEKLVSQSDKSHQDSSSIHQQRDDQQEVSNYIQVRKQPTHTHETSTGFDDEMNNHRCQHDNRSSLTYFSQLRDKIIQCDES